MTSGSIRFLNPRTAHCSADVIVQIAEYFGHPLPSEYLQILKDTDGIFGECRRSEDEGATTYFCFYEGSEVIQVTRDYEFEEYEPEFLLVGNNGAGVGYCLKRPDTKREKVHWAEIAFDELGSNDEDNRLLFDSLEEFVSHLVERQ